MLYHPPLLTSKRNLPCVIRNKCNDFFPLKQLSYPFRFNRIQSASSISTSP